MSKAPAKRDDRDERDTRTEADIERGISREGEHHGLSPMQIKKIEDARYDDSMELPPEAIEDQRKQKAEAEKEAKAEADAQKKRQDDAEKAAEDERKRKAK